MLESVPSPSTPDLRPTAPAGPEAPTGIDGPSERALAVALRVELALETGPLPSEVAPVHLDPVELEAPVARESPDHSLSYVVGRAFGDYITDKYFSLPEDVRRRWDRARLVHHGALGQILTEGSRALADNLPRGKLRTLVLAAERFGEGLADSDLHDRERWYTEGALASTGVVLMAAFQRRRA